MTRWFKNPWRYTQLIAPRLYWRITFLGHTYTDVPWPQLNEVIFAATAGGAQLATGGTASGSATGWAVGQGPANAFDGSDSTRVEYIAPTAGSPGWLRYQFAAPTIVGAVGIKAFSADLGTTLQAFAVESSADGVTWTQHGVSPVFSAFTSLQTQWFTLTPLPANIRANARVWRIVNVTNNGTNGLHKIYFRATSGGATLCTGGCWYGSSGINGSVGPWRCFDGTLFSGLFGGDTPFAQYVFPAATNPAFVALQRPTGGNIAGDPTAFDVQWSVDGINFTTALSLSSVPAWTSGETKEWAL